MGPRLAHHRASCRVQVFSSILNSSVGFEQALSLLQIGFMRGPGSNLGFARERLYVYVCVYMSI